MNRSKNHIILIVLLLAIITLPSITAGARLICDYCKKEITGEYITAEGKYYHPGHFKCSKCGRSIGTSRYFMENGKPICENCFDQFHRPSCGYCLKPIEDNYIESGGKKYHPECYDKNIAVKCFYCGQSIEGEYIIDHWGNSYCARHQKELPQCEYCGMLISPRTTGGGKTYPDGRHVCGFCLQTAVNDTEQAERFLEEARQKLMNYGIFISTKGISLTLVDKPTLSNLYGDSKENHLGIVKFQESKLLGISARRKFEIYILYGVPKLEFISAAAHELMHVWQYSRKILDNDDAFCEGSCNYAARLVLQTYDDGYARFLLENMEQNSDPVYGEGYRRVSRLVDARGIEGWLEDLEDDSDFPEGF